MNEGFGELVKQYRQNKTEVLEEKNCPNATFYTKNATWTGLGLNPGFRADRPPIIHLRYVINRAFLGVLNK